MLKLNNLTSLVKKRKRVARGGSRGGTAGKGHKGQKARSGPKIRPGFEGGQMPLYRRLPKRGFNNTVFSIPVYIINIGQLDKHFQEDDVVTQEVLVQKGLIKGLKGISRFAIKILGQGELSKKLSVDAHSFSKSAQQAIQKAGGKIQLIGKTE